MQNSILNLYNENVLYFTESNDKPDEYTIWMASLQKAEI